MVTEYKLPYSAKEIERKLSKIDDVAQTVGNSKTMVMSQKAVTDAIETIPESMGYSAWWVFEPVNVLEGVNLTYRDGYSWNDSGAITSNSYTTKHRAVEPLLSVIGGCGYSLRNCVCSVRFYNSKKAQIGLLGFNSIEEHTFFAPDDAVYMGITISLSSVSSTSSYEYVESLYRTTPISGEMFAKYEMTTAAIKNPELVSLLSPLKEKVIVNFGDSIFGNARPPEDISTRLAELTGATVHNCGFGGCRMAQHPASRYDAFSMYRLADAITTRDFTLQDAAFSDSGGLPTYFPETLSLLKSIDFNSVDIITIAYGTNDWNGGYNSAGSYILGEPAEKLDTTRLKGALRYSIETILAKYPHIRIFICCPTYRINLDKNGEIIEDTDTWISATYKLTDCIAQEREVAEEYKLPFIDNYSIGINRVNRSHYFPTKDGTHHNINGRRLIAEHMAKELY